MHKFNQIKLTYIVLNYQHIFQRMDLGECPKIHDLALKADYEMASKRKDYYYDIDVCNH